METTIMGFRVLYRGYIETMEKKRTFPSLDPTGA